MKNSSISRSILGIKLNSTTLRSVLRDVIVRHKMKRKFTIVTPNPEQVVEASRDPEFARILNKANLSVPDGVGLSAAKYFLDLPNPKNIFLKTFVNIFRGIYIGFLVLFNKNKLLRKLNIIKGREIFMEILNVANKRGWKIILLGNDKKSAQYAVKKLEHKFRHIKFVGLQGPALDKDGMPRTLADKLQEEKIISKINEIRPDFIFVGFGAPVQEKWLSRNLSGLNVIGTMGVGGTFDYITGLQKLPPRWVEKMGLEWLWRLFYGNQNLKRLWIAVVVFPWKVFVAKLRTI